MNAEAVSNMGGKFLSNVVKQATMKLVSNLKKCFQKKHHQCLETGKETTMGFPSEKV